MTDRIDHAAEARRALEGAGDGRSVATDASAVAQVHATLALVEQQRIANLLALIAPEDPRDYDVWPAIKEGLGTP